MAKYVYTFGGGSAEGTASDKNLLGGKGANLAEMCSLGIPVPAGFTVSTECCTAYYAGGCKLPAELTDQVLAALKKTETIMGMKYGDPDNPLLVSCRSGARTSMPGMMDTVLNVGLSTATIPGMIAKTEQPALRLGFLPPPDHDVRRRGDGEGGRPRTGPGQGHPQDPR